MTRRDQVLAALPAAAHGVVLESAAVVSWYLRGARTTVPLGGASVVAVLVTRDGETVLAPVMEAERLGHEEGVADVAAVPWAHPLVPDAWRSLPGVLHESHLELPLRAARASLDTTEAQRYRSLGAEVATAVTGVARGLRPDDGERAVAGQLAAAAYEIGAEPVVVLVAGESRLALRHPLPGPGPLGGRAMIVLGARRHGLVVNLTRWVRFGAAPGPELDAEHRLRLVEAEALTATTPGRALADVLAVVRGAYARHGFAADEWLNHHQGGPTGYLGRDPKVTPETVGTVAENQAFAWNPSAPGLKAEDTVLATSAGIELLTHDPAWPSELVAGRRRPLTLLL